MTSNTTARKVIKNMEARLLENGADKAGLASNPITEKAGALEIVTSLTLGELAPLVRDRLRRGWEEFCQAGTLLRQIKEMRLWFPKYETFAACCRVEFGIGQPRAFQVIDAQAVIAEMPESLYRGIKGGLNERQLRELARVPAGKRVEVLQKAMEAARAALNPLTAKIIRQVALEVCPELKGPAKRARRTIKINDGWATFEELWEAWTAATRDARAKVMYRLKDDYTFSRIFKGMERKLALVEANKAGKPYRRGPKSILD